MVDGGPQRAAVGVVSRTRAFERDRYDPLGRRVLVRTRTEGDLCNYDANVS